MDSAELLDLLGNGNRRRILRLLAHKPCYVTEISEYLGVSPKAVIDHLSKLEDAGLIESTTDDQRRKYFYITRDLRLEVNVSPYEFGTKSAYPASTSLDVTSWRYVSLDLEVADVTELAGDSATPDATPGSTPDGDAADVTGDDATTDTTGNATATEPPETNPHPQERARELAHLQQLENELSLAQRWVRGRITAAMDELTAEFDGEDARLYSDVLAAVADGATTARGVSHDVEAPVGVVEEALEGLAQRELVERDGSEWSIPD